MNAKDLDILLIEDNPGDARLIREMLADAGPARFRLACADRLSTGLERLAQGDVEAVLLDLGLPDSQGLDTLRRVVAELPMVPTIVVLTGLDDEEMGMQAIEAGAQDYLVKGQVDANLLSRALRYAVERKRARDRLWQSEERYRSTLDNMMEGCQIVGFDWRYLYVNKATARHGRQTKEALVDHTMMEVYPGIEETEMFGFLRRCMEERIPHHMENEFTYPDGSKGWFELSIQPVPEGVFILSIDITERVRSEMERRRAEEARRESEERFRRVYEHMAVGVAQVSLDYRIEAANEAYCCMLGYDEEELVGKYLRDITHPETVEENLRQQAQLVTGEIDHYRMEKQFIHKNGRVVYGILDANLVCDAQGKPCYCLGSVLDITARKQMEEALRRSEALLNTTQRMARIGGWEWDVAAQTMTWTEEIYRIHDIEPGEIAPLSPEHITRSLECYDAQDRPAILVAFQSCAEQGEAYDMELPFTTVKGRRLWIRTAASAVLEQGRVAKVVGHIMDITEHKRAEEELREYREHLEELVKERTADLKKLVNAMAGREVRMAELKDVIRKLRAQLEEAGLKPAADDPLLGEGA